MHHPRPARALPESSRDDPGSGIRDVLSGFGFYERRSQSVVGYPPSQDGSRSVGARTAYIGLSNRTFPYALVLED